jgi:hypothetical protein
MILILVIVLISGCRDTEPANGNDQPKGNNTGATVKLQGLLDTEDLWLSARELSAAICADADNYIELPGALGFFRFAYSSDIEGSPDALKAVKEAAKDMKWPVPEDLRKSPLLAVNAFDDAMASTGMKIFDAASHWAEIDSAYGGINRDDFTKINDHLQLKQAVAQYNIDAAGFFTEVDHEASLCGYVAANNLAEVAGFEPATMLLAAYGDWWLDLPGEGDATVDDFLSLLVMYDIVTFPRALDIAYRQTNDVLLYHAMADILGTYKELIDIDGLGEAVGPIAHKERCLGQLCMLARLFRRMYAFTDVDGYFEAAEGILKQIGPACLAADANTAMMYTHSLLMVTEPALHVVIVGPMDDPNWSQFAHLARDRYEPRLAVMPLDNDRDTDLIDEIGYYGTETPTCFVCVDINCFSPIKDPQEVEGLFLRGYEEIGKMRVTKMKKLETGE